MIRLVKLLGIIIFILNANSMLSQTVDSIQSGKFKIPFNNKGIYSDTWQTNRGAYDNTTLIFSNGFILSGVYEDSIWLNATASSMRIEDYIPGSYETENNDSLNIIYKLTKDDPPFGQTWQKYKGAVKQGADFYDGNKNGIYDPIDFNNNGKWELNEDKPYLIGDETYTFTYHDGLQSNRRYLWGQKPVGIEITNYVYKFLGDENTNDVIFIRYQIKNNGMFRQSFDSVYFANWADPDIKDYSDDLFGTDTLINSTFCYSKNNDKPNESYSLLTQYILTPTIKTNNQNSFAIEYNTQNQRDTLFGWNNQIMNSAMMSISHPTGDDPNAYEIRKWWMFGYQLFGAIDPCNWSFGEVLDEDCSKINNHYMYSGDPIRLTGWIDTYATDIRYLQTTGPFKLEKGKPQNIIVAYMVGTGDVPLEAVKKAKIKARWLKTFYPYLADGEYFEDQNKIDSTNTEEINFDFVLYQNYPNPFNPVTKIKFNIEGRSTSSLDQSESVTLKIYDLLGREVQTLIDEKLSPGIHEVNFDGSKLSSGIYFYSLRQGAKFTQKKMLLLK